MSKATHKLPYADALSLAELLERRLAPSCERILIAGSIRRRKSEVGDIELVAQPKLTPELDMFGLETGNQYSQLDDALSGLSTEGYTKNGDKYKQFSYEGVTVDLFIATRETWGAIATIRTGSADFTHWLVTSKRHGGGCPSGLKVREGRVCYENVSGPAFDTSTEEKFFQVLEQRWVEPIERVDGRWKR
jgi:DNA polymerase/3'-5' exonuclease PolX